MGRVNIRKILSDSKTRRELMVRVIIATQAREGITTTRRQAEVAYEAARLARTPSEPSGSGTEPRL